MSDGQRTELDIACHENDTIRMAELLGDPDAVPWTRERADKVNAPNFYNGATPLMTAIVHSSFECAAMLVQKYHADVDMACGEGLETALHGASHD